MRNESLLIVSFGSLKLGFCAQIDTFEGKTLLVLPAQIFLKFLPFAAVVALAHIKNEFAWVDRANKSFQFTIVGVRRVGHLEIEGQIFVVLVIPAGKNYKNCRFFSI